MNDIELLQLAANGSGLEFGVIHQRPHRRCAEGWTPWNPLTDDGDALRLIVKLQLSVRHRVSSVDAGFKQTTPVQSEEYGSDPYAATRRAIVRAAAEIGRNMK